MEGLVERCIVSVWTCERKRMDKGIHRGLIGVMCGRRNG